MRSYRGQRGQMSLVIALMVTTFLFLLGFAVGVGLLVNAKINLQNAADLAAYAGAGVQARQLTHISYLNYEMRRQLKKYLFRTYVLGNYAQPQFPRSANASGTYGWISGGNSGSPTLAVGVPATCVFFEARDNFCQNSVLAKIEVPAANPIDPISGVQAQVLSQVETARQEQCRNIGKTNQALQYLWLFNADPRVAVPPPSTPPEVAKNIRRVGAVATGLGLVPREIILSMRIKTLASYVNAPAFKGVTRASVQALQAPGNPENERTIAAFLSAYNTLGPHSFPSFTMDELLPTRGTDSDLLELEEIGVDKFHAYSLDMEVDPQQQGNCLPKLRPSFITGHLPIGVVKSPKKLTYYAVVLRATIQLPLFGEISLKAMAAAQPFGSRIGPRLDAGKTLFALGAAPNGALLAGGSAGAVALTNQLTGSYLPNLPILNNDTSEMNGGWNSRTVLGAMYEQLAQLAGATGAGTPPITSVSAEKMYQYAMAPSPWERDQYNIPTSFPDPFTVNFDSSDTMAFWAPLMPLKDQAQMKTALRQAVENKILGTGATNPEAVALAAGLVDRIEQYASTNLANGTGEDGEGLKIVRIKDPLVVRDAAGKATIATLPKGLILNAPDQIKSSFNTELNPDFQAMGRTGYSVKLVSFRQLMNPGGASTNGVDVWTNIPTGDPDLPLLDH